MKSRLLILVLRLFALLPLSLSRPLGSLIGKLCWLTRNRMARTTLTNLRLCFPELSVAEREELARRSLVHTGQAITETGMVWLWPAQRTLACVHAIEGFDLLQQAQAQQRGVIVLGPHLGNWELLGLWLNTCGLGQNWQMYQAPDDPAFGALILNARSRSGAKMVPTDSKGVAQLLQALRRGDLTGILPDQVPPPSGGEYAPFFGVPAFTMTLVNRLQQKTGARLIMGFARRTGGSKPGFHIVFREPDPAIYADDLATALAAMNRSAENLIREAPEQYQWEYKRFKRQPEGCENPY